MCAAAEAQSGNAEINPLILCEVFALHFSVAGVHLPNTGFCLGVFSTVLEETQHVFQADS
jgi:hypothetical protein